MKTANNSTGSWSRVRGIISKVDSTEIYVHICSLSDNFVLPYLTRNGKNDLGEINLINRSTSDILRSSAKAVKSLQLTSSNHNVASCLLGFSHNSIESIQPIFPDPDFLSSDKIAAVYLCSDGKPIRLPIDLRTVWKAHVMNSKLSNLKIGHPITIIHGPPGISCFLNYNCTTYLK